jgi:serine/threonine-protein kinase PpkA
MAYNKIQKEQVSKNFPKVKGYVIKKKLGEGGMASVFLAIDKELHKMVAIKFFVANIFGGEKKGKRFLKEARLLRKLRHPNIVNVFNVQKSGQYSLIVMEYLQESLRDVINKRKKLPPREALQICLQIADALFYVHARGIVHRDVKPENIMFRNDFTPVLLDFGIVKSISGQETSLTETGAFIGTPYYMSPEQCSMDKIDGRTDIYSLGVVLFEMLTGRVPYRSRDARTIFKQHKDGSIPKLPREYEKIQPLIEVMLAKNRKNRLRSQKRLFDHIKRLLNDESIMGRQVGISDTNPRAQASLQNQVTMQSKRPATAISASKPKKQTEQTPKKNKPKKKKRKKKGRNKLKKMFLLFLILILLLVLVLKYFFGYTFEEIFFGFFNLLVDGLRKVVDLFMGIFKK